MDRVFVRDMHARAWSPQNLYEVLSLPQDVTEQGLNFNLNSDGPRIQVMNLKHADDALKANLKIPIHRNYRPLKFKTPEYNLKGINVEMQIEIRWRNWTRMTEIVPYYDYTFSVKMSQSSHDSMDTKNEQNKLICVFNSKYFDIHDMRLTAFKEVIYKIHESRGNANINNTLMFDVHLKVNLDESNPYTMFQSLYDDTDLTDFELRAGGTSIKVHKAVLAASSPILRSMLSGPWKEAVEAAVDIPETSKMTLEDFKTYLYSRKVPVTGCEQLLLLAHYYQMTHLESECIDQIVRTANSGNILELCHFACVQRMTKLFKALLRLMISKSIEIDDLN